MRCRQTILFNNKRKLVWFGSYGKDENGHSLKAKNYVEGGEAIVNSLTQKLSLIKGELWYSINAGIPLFNKSLSKDSLDSYIVDIVLNTRDVIEIQSFTSKIEEGKYYVYLEVLTKYGSVKLQNSLM
jgi:hypothetical protein